jgi:hypothetical protein
VTDSPPIIGREEILTKLIDRLKRPDDLRNNPRDFISTGFHGLAGSGKSRLLQELAKLARTVTPYVVEVDFDPRSRAFISSSFGVLQYLVDVLEEVERAARPMWRRLFWRWSNPFLPCRQVISKSTISVSQTVTVTSGRADHVSQNLVLDDRIPPGLIQAFSFALTKLHAKKQTKQLFGDCGRPKSCPLILIALDSVDLATPELRRWLPEFHSIGKNTLQFHLMIAAAGRLQQTGLTEAALPPLTAEESRLLLVSYARSLTSCQTRDRNAEGLKQILESEPIQSRLVSQGDGIPMLLHLLVDSVSLTPSISQIENAVLPNEHEARVLFVVEQYFDRLKEEAYRQRDDTLWQRYYLMLCGAIPRSIPNDDLLRTLLSSLPGELFKNVNHDALIQGFLHESFVRRLRDRVIVVHSLIREGALHYLEKNDRELLDLLHAKSAEWLRNTDDQPNYFYHALRRAKPAVFNELKAALSDSLQQKQWPLVHAILDAAADSPLSSVEKSWITLFAADLAFGEGDGALALKQLRKLLGGFGVTELDGEFAARLESWLGFSDSIETALSNGQSPDFGRERIDEVVWWADYKRLPRTLVCALQFAGEAAVHAKDLCKGRELITRSLEIAKSKSFSKDIARALELLGEIALMIGPLDVAAQNLSQATALYSSLEECASAKREQRPHRQSRYFSGATMTQP